jgi:stage V sporulation protein S
MKAKQKKEIEKMNDHTNDAVGSHVIRISAKTSAKAAAGSLAMVLKDHGFAEILVIGAGAVNQAVKAVAICRGHVAPLGQDIVMIPAFGSTEIEDNERTRMRLIVEPR